MIKEIILAIILGGLLGFGITGGYLAMKNSRPVTTDTSQSSDNVTPQPTSANNPTPTIIDTEDASTSSQIIIDSPENESIFTNSQVTIKGSTVPNSYLIVTTPSNNYTTTADATGKFSLDIEIDSGANLVQINAVDPQDNQSTVEIIVTYSTAKF